jgi:hypothetical protein
MLKVLESLNIASAIFFERASCVGSLDTSTAFGPRNFAGEGLEIVTMLKSWQRSTFLG